LTLAPIAHAQGSVALPGSKSISNRTLLLAALADGTTRLAGLLDADDTQRMIEALRMLGVRVDHDRDSGDCVVAGVGPVFPRRSAALFLGNAGTAVRPLTAVLAMQGGDYTIDGVARMRERPIGDLVDALRHQGCDLRYLGNAGFPPLAIGASGGRAGGRIPIRGDVSSQFLSALLLALPVARGAGQTATAVEVVTPLISRPYVEITTRLMQRFGVVVATPDASTFLVEAGARYASPGTLHVEGDASSASYFLAAGVLGGGPVRVTGVGRNSIQGDVAFADVLARQGADIRFGDDWIEARRGGPLAGGVIDCLAIPDAAMTLAIVALFARAPMRLVNIGSWRVKETDRIAAMATELAKLGARVAAGDDWLEVAPLATFRHAVIDTYDDHRMAMCFALAAFGGAGVTINDPACVRKTFPAFFERLAQIAGGATDTAAQALPTVIAIDGPAASGKGTVAQRIAEALGMRYLDSGSLYRLVALQALERQVAADDVAGLTQIAAALAPTFGDARIDLEGREVTDALRGEAVSAMASRVAVHAPVREALLARQRAFRVAPGLVAEGRDMGTVVFPDAQLKVFLTASAEARAGRRHKQLIEKGISAKMDDLLRDIRERDARDSTRAASPLVPAADAVVLDSTDLSVAAVTDAVLALYRKQCGEPGSAGGRR
ncbi:MAG: 3-phosphoshikimate 1-carboxyvinyltransferase, partial [Casimicrobiaceae bacterium]